MGKTDKSARMFYHALAALVFTAVCAWSAAALYTLVGTDAREPAAETPEPAPTRIAGRFRGILLRYEERLPAGAFPAAEAGTRLSAAETGTESALFFPESDGLEYLTPGDAESLTPGKLEALLEEGPGELEDTPRLVYGFTIFCVALLEGRDPPMPGPCRLTLDGAENRVHADLLSVTTDALGRSMLLLRLTEFPEALYEMRAVTGTIEG